MKGKLKKGPHRKAMASLTLPGSWELWNERNTRVFKKKFAPPFVLLDKIKKEASLWFVAGAKCLSAIMPGY